MLGVVTYALRARSGKRSEQAIRGDVAALPDQTAHAVTAMLDDIRRAPDPDLGWEAQYAAAAYGFAPILPGTDRNAVLVEFPYGAHSAVLLALEDEDPSLRAMRLWGVARNGIGARFHVRETSGGAGSEVVTLDSIRPLRNASFICRCRPSTTG